MNAAAHDNPNIVVVSDVHLDHNRFGRTNPATGRSTAYESTLACLTAAADHAIDIRAAAFVSTGDETMSGRARPETIETWADIIRRLTHAGIAVVDVVGNHSYYGGIPATERTWNHRLADIDGVTLIDTANVVTLPNGIQIAGLAWPRRAELAATNNTGLDADIAASRHLQAAIDTLKHQIDPTRPALFAGHLAVNEASLGTDRRGTETLIHAVFHEPMIAANELADAPWTHAALGHIHKRQTFADGRVSYVGSIDRLDFSEAGDPKGFSVIDAATGDVCFHQTDARPMLTVDDSLPTPDNIIEGSLIKAVCAPGERTISPTLKASIDAAGAVLVKTVAAPKVAATGSAPNQSCPSTVSPLEALNAWLDTQPHSGQQRDRIVDAARHLQTGLDTAA
jgi:DNA repair exonuclease SbcCD nuclease subunit